MRIDKRAFTLIELLVVIAIIGLSGAILTPVLGRARESGRRAMCGNNLRQHGVAWYLYLDEHNDCFPPRPGGATHHGIFGGLHVYGGKYGQGSYADVSAADRVLNPYLGIYDETSQNLGVFHCPSDVNSCEDAFWGSLNSFDYWGNSYISNSYVLSSMEAGTAFSSITTPQDRTMLEMCSPGSVPGHKKEGYYKNSAMVLFLDGHVAGPFRYDGGLQLP